MIAGVRTTVQAYVDKLDRSRAQLAFGVGGGIGGSI